MRGGTDTVQYSVTFSQISIHPPHAGRDATQACDTRNTVQFQSTRPMRGGTFQNVQNVPVIRPFQSTRPMRGGTFVSITTDPSAIISIHPPHAGRDGFIPPFAATTWKFQSTRPMRGGTTQACDTRNTVQFQSTRPMRGGTLME